MVHIILNAFLRADNASDNVSHTKADFGSDQDLTSKLDSAPNSVMTNCSTTEWKTLPQLLLSVSQHGKQQYLLKKTNHKEHMMLLTNSTGSHIRKKH